MQNKMETQNKIEEKQESTVKVIDQNMDEDEFDVYEPGSIDELISYLKRNFNALNESSILTRKKAIVNIYTRLQEEEKRISQVISQQIMVKFFKQLLQTFSDKAEKCREYSIIIFKELIGKCDDMTQFLPYLFSVLTERVNCQDLEGIQDLPEVMRPPPGQKPKRMIKLVEDCEEIRIQLCELLYDVIVGCQNNELVNYLDDVTNILRTLAMDPSGDIQREACKTIATFCRSNQEMLLHFTEILGRSILLPLISKKSKVRIAALDALGAILYCGVWKYNAFVFENLVGFRDPNSVPIKDFYEPSHNINYFATLITDPKSQVREMFLRQAGDWITELPDKYDHHPRLIPYILSGLFDHQPEIQQACFEILEEAGVLEQKDKEKEILEKQQYGLDSEWTQDRKLADLFIDEAIPHRPNLGARMLVRGHVRKWWGALYKEIKEVNVEQRIRASHLLKYAVIYTEDHLTQFLDQFVKHLVWHTVEKPNKEDKIVANNISRVFELMGRFCPPSSYMHLIISGLKGEFSQNEDYIRAVIKAFACIIQGSLEAVVPEIGLTETKIQLVKQVIDVLSDQGFLENISSHNFKEAGILISNTVSMLFKQCNRRQLLEMNNSGLQILTRLSFIITHIALFEKTYILSQPYDKETTYEIIDKLKDNQVHKLIEKLLSLEDNVAFQIEEFYKETCFEQGSFEQLNFNSYLWRQLIGQFLYLIFNFNSFKETDQPQILLLIEKHSQKISSIVLKNNNPEISDFMAKFAIMLLTYLRQEKDIQEDLQLQIYRCSIHLIGPAFYWLSSTDIKLNKKILDNFIVLIKEASNLCFCKANIEKFDKIMSSNKMSDIKGFAEFLYQLPITFKKFYKKSVLEYVEITHSVINQFLVPVFKKNLKLLERLSVIPISKKKKVQQQKNPNDISGGQYYKFGEGSDITKYNRDKKIIKEDVEGENQEDEDDVQDETQEKDKKNDENENEQEGEIKETKEEQKEQQTEVKPQEKEEEEILEPVNVIPLLFQFVLQRIEQLAMETSQKLVQEVFETMINLVELIPEYPSNYYRGSSYIIEDYERFCNKIIKYLIDERDMEQKKYYMLVLKKMFKKTPYNFGMELQIAEKHKQHARCTILQQLIYETTLE